MKKGDRVTLLERVGHHMPGAEGEILAVLPDGTVTVSITHKQNCMRDAGVLPSQPKSRFRLGGRCPRF